MSFYKDAITESCRNNITILRDFEFIQNFYLAGGTALALQIGHRVSTDLDIYCLQEQASLEDLFEFVPHKFSDRPQFLAVVVKALVYFEDAEEQPMPSMLVPVEWKDIRSYCEDASRKLTRRLSGLN